MWTLIVVFSLTLLLFWIFFQRRLKEAERNLRDLFKAVSFEAMEANSRMFFDLAKNSFEKHQASTKEELEHRKKEIEATLLPFRETIKQLDFHQRDLEKQRTGAYASLTKQIEAMALAEKDLRKETALLTQSLRSPQIRGAWGEIHLRRVVELAGLVNHCDFFEQQSVDTGERMRRPDLLIRLPGDRQIVVDAKTPLSAFLDASDAGDDDLRKKKLQEHAGSVRKHIKELAGKEYWKQFDSSPEYVILFLPAEAFFSAALQADPSLIEAGADQNILVATPTTLIAILRAVALSWKQENLSKSAKEISGLGQELYERIGIFCEHWNKVGKNLNTAVDAFNQSTASLETRVLVSARKLKEAGHIRQEPPETIQIDRIAKSVTIP